MLEFRSLIRAIVLIWVVGAVNSLQAQDGLSAAFSRLHSVGDFSSRVFGPSIATADFNNDTHPDGAVLFRNKNTFQIEVHFRFRQVSTITFASRFPSLAISALDVNRDGNADLIVEEPFSRERLFIWLNDGSGSFHLVHAEDYPAARDDDSRCLALPSQSPQCLAMSVPGKSRVRASSTGINILAPSTHLVGVPRRPAFHLAEFTSAPNLLRGPPAAVLL